MYSFLFSAAAFELTLGEIVADLPRDAGAVVVLLMLGAFVFLTWHGSRRSTIETYKARSHSVAEAEIDPAALAQPSEASMVPPTMATPTKPASRRSRKDSERINWVS
ncbi:MAG: hypothetical protein WD766_04955 [Gemmatimonadota bacterium]